jgi:hypothetical protein
MKPNSTVAAHLKVMLRTSKPNLADLILHVISLDYHETLRAACGYPSTPDRCDRQTVSVDLLTVSPPDSLGGEVNALLFPREPSGKSSVRGAIAASSRSMERKSFLTYFWPQG